MLTYGEIRQALSHVQKPCAFLHKDLLEQNIETLLQLAGNKSIRIASKSIRSVAILKIIMDYSNRFQGVMCFTAEEALYLHEQGFDDLLIAYPTWDETQLKRISEHVKKGATITVMIDNLEHIKRLESIAEATKGKFLVAIDIDLSTSFPGLYFGVFRSPLHEVTDVVELIERVNNSQLLTLDGLMGYEAQIAGVPDDAPNQFLKNIVIRTLKKLSNRKIVQKRSEIMKALQQLEIPIRFFNGGGTGSLQLTQQDEFVTEVTIGSGFYNSHLFDKYQDFQLEPAVAFAVEITRQPTENIYTCAGGGYVASGAVGKDKLPEIHLPKGASLLKNEAVGEVQTPVKYDGSITLQLGDPIIFRHSKAGELCERFNHLHILMNNEIIDTVTTYRGDGKCFL